MVDRAQESKYEEVRVRLLSKLRKTGRHPFLFVGSGMSRRYLNTPDWEGLLRTACSQLSESEFLFDAYRADVARGSKFEELPAVASRLEHDFNKAVFSIDAFGDFRERYRSELRSGTSALKLFLSQRLLEAKPCLLREEIELLGSLGDKISGIITTNYDTMLEDTFPDFSVYVGQNELLFSELYELGEIYKIHGSCLQPSSLILTQEDYTLFEERKAYLVAKILTIFLEYPIIFMGYSMNDSNIRGILKAIAHCVGVEQLDMLRNRMIFVQRGSDIGMSVASFVFENGETIDMTAVTTDDFSPIYEAIGKTETLYAPKVLRRLRKDVYRLVDDPGQDRRIIATGFEGARSIPEDVPIIIGVGTSSAGHGVPITTKDLYLDAVFDDQNLSPRLVVEQYLPTLLPQNSGGLPVLKYVSAYDGELPKAVVNFYSKHTRLDNFLNRGILIQKKTYRKSLDSASVEEILRREDGTSLNNRCLKLCFLESDEMDAESLRRFLQKEIDADAGCLDNSEMRRLIKMFDFIKYESALNTFIASANT